MESYITRLLRTSAHQITLGLLICISSLVNPALSADKILFWDTPQHGGNSFNGSPPDESYFKALRATGATWVRLAFAKWKGEGRDFLICNADHYTSLSQPDLGLLLKTMNAADHAGLKVVITPLSLPGMRWKQQNNGVNDNRLWQDKAYWEQAATFWRDLALALKDRPAIVAYNIVNEPTPELITDLKSDNSQTEQMAWVAKNAGAAHFLPAFYERVIKAIREVDPNTPVMVDSGWYANAQGFSYWPEKLNDDKVLYSFHMYEPYEVTSTPNLNRKPQLRYPGVKYWFGPKEVVWNKSIVRAYLSAPFDWARAHDVMNNRVVAGEFGCMRQWVDCGNYLNDVLDTLDEHKAHWAFYSFREDVWEGMDYELGPDMAPARFYDLMKRGKASDIDSSHHKLLDIIEQHIAASPRYDADFYDGCAIEA